MRPSIFFGEVVDNILNKYSTCEKMADVCVKNTLISRPNDIQTLENAEKLEQGSDVSYTPVLSLVQYCYTVIKYD